MTTRRRWIETVAFASAGTLGLHAAPAPVPLLQLGSEALEASQFKALQGKRVGLLTHQAGLNRRGRSTVELLKGAPGVKLAALFAPEHGLRGDIPAGTEFGDTLDVRTGLPLFSLYGPGPVRKPTPKMLRGLDVLVYDMQDVGCRSYTFISTMGLSMESCAESGVEFMVLDRPNPIGGVRVEGPGLDPRYRSLVSQWNIPYAYGLTCGELARMIVGERWIKPGLKLTVVPMKGWKRAMVWKDTGLRWVPTSPKIPTPGSATHYTALGLLGEIAKGSGLHTGGLFDRPFEWVSAAWMDAARVAASMNALKLKTVRFRHGEASHSGRPYGVVFAEYLDAARAPLVAQTFYYLDAIKKVHGKNLGMEWGVREPGSGLFDKVAGGTQLRRDLAAGRPARGIIDSWSGVERDFRTRRKPYLMYW
ncbi:MAG: DUF1343 domain-containing protein [Verrucomicrobia bacterium]|nr:DUF1343 domain-containing protein [Verrucomicrobiota bacterium]